MSNSIISKVFQDKEIFFDKIENELYLNAKKVSLEFNKRLDNWKRSPETTEYMEALSRSLNLSKRDLIIIRQGGNNKNSQGTWIHKKLIIAFARWLSPEFAVWCDLQIEEILKSQNSQSTQPIQTSQTFDNFNFVQQTQQNREILDFIELINSQSPINLFFLDKIYKYFKVDSPLNLLQIDLKSFYFIPRELGKFLNKSAVEINKILEHKWRINFKTSQRLPFIWL